MRIDGRKIADEIKSELKKDIEDLAKQNITPKLAIITLGNEEAWKVYVKQKIKVAAELGIKAILLNLEDTDEDRLIKTIESIDIDPNYHGIIVQRPLPKNIDRDRVITAISQNKDVDGFREDSPYGVPLFLAVKKLIEQALIELNVKKGWQMLNFAVIGKGETAGTPTINGLIKLGIKPEIIDSKTNNRAAILKNADVVISCVGKMDVLNANELKLGSILIGVGIRSEDGHARGDYDEEEIEKTVAAYTPTPGGVGPVNLAYLFSNLVNAANKTLDKI